MPDDPCSKLKLEPSGLVYLQKQKIWVAVSDNFEDLVTIPGGSGYVIFGFDPNQVRANNTIPVYPMVSGADAKRFQPYDLEGLTLDDEGNLFAIGSLALHTRNPSRDSWFRGQGYRLSIIESEGDPLGVHVDILSHWSANKRRDIREWVLSNAGFGWSLAHLQNRPEGSAADGGINVEALSMSNGNPLLGFRGPLTWGGSSWQATAAEIKLNGPDASPELKRLTLLNGKPGQRDDTTKQFGFRGLAAIPGYPHWYAAIVGSAIYCDQKTRIGCDQLEVLIWNKETGEVPVRFQLPDGFVGEGIDVSGTSPDSSTGMVTLTLGIVDDRKARFMPLSLSFNP